MKREKRAKSRMLALLLALSMVLSVFYISPQTARVYAADAQPVVCYGVHAQTYGWMAQKKNGAVAGTVGKRVEALTICLNTKGAKAADGTALTGGIKYRAHVQSVGWMKPVTQKANGKTVKNNIASGIYTGTTGKGYRMEAVEISLTGKMAQEYDILYRVYVQKNGWMPWCRNGLTAGTIGESKQIEMIEIKLMKKLPSNAVAKLTGKGHIQTIGWLRQGTITMGSNKSLVLGTTGKGLRLEAIKMVLTLKNVSGDILTSTHVQGKGWKQSVGNAKVSGSIGKGLRIEAVKFKLTGQLAEYYDIWYRAHTQTFGWLDWTSNGAAAGTEGISKRIEAIEVKILPKGSAAPGSTKRPFVKGYEDNWQTLPGALSLVVNKQANVVVAYKGSVPIRAMLCSTGLATPTGTYNTPNKFRWLGLVGPSYGQYCTQIYGDFLFHSVPYESRDNRTLMTDEYNKLGTTCSHGCIRLCVADAKWIYDNCPLGTKVELRDSSDPGPLGKPSLTKLPASQTWDPTDPEIK